MAIDPFTLNNVDEVIRAAERSDIELTRSDFRYIDGEAYLDGMDPWEWLEAMLMD